MRNCFDDFVQETLIEVDVGLLHAKQIPKLVHVLTNLCKDSITHKVLFDEVFHFHVLEPNRTLRRQVLCVKQGAKAIDVLLLNFGSASL